MRWAETLNYGAEMDSKAALNLLILRAMPGDGWAVYVFPLSCRVVLEPKTCHILKAVQHPYVIWKQQRVCIIIGK
ncbi:hypothetical protein WJX77_010490 [Trebouxia sp. C0004]